MQTTHVPHYKYDVLKKNHVTSLYHPTCSTASNASSTQSISILQQHPNDINIHCTDNDLSPHIQRNLKRKQKIIVQPVKTNHTSSTGSVMDGHRSYFHGEFSTSSFWGRCLGVGRKAPQNSRKKQHKYPNIPVKKKKQRHLQNTSKYYKPMLKSKS